MSLIIRNAKEYRSMTAQLMSQNLPIVSCSFGIFCVLRHSNHFILTGANNRTPSLPTDSSRPLVKQIEILSEHSFDSLWVYVLCQIMARERLQLTSWNLASEKYIDKRFWPPAKLCSATLIYARVTRVPSRDFAFLAKSLRGQWPLGSNLAQYLKGLFVTWKMPLL